jgi:ABC-type phosphate/phosphonate transport system substrate-binding protein
MTRKNLMVCPHDTASAPDRWFRFAQYLSQHLSDTTVHFDLTLDFQEFHDRMAQADLIYSNPADTVHLAKTQSFIPLARASNLHDEVVFIAHPDIPNPSLSSLAGQPVVTVVSMLPTQIALRILAREGVQPAEVINRDAWNGVMRSVLSGEVPFGFVYKDTFDGLSANSRAMVQAFYTSQEHIAFHSLALAPHNADLQTELTAAVLAMTDTDTGPAVLKELDMAGWCPIPPDTFADLRALVESK